MKTLYTASVFLGLVGAAYLLFFVRVMTPTPAENGELVLKPLPLLIAAIVWLLVSGVAQWIFYALMCVALWFVASAICARLRKERR